MKIQVVTVLLGCLVASIGAQHESLPECPADGTFEKTCTILGKKKEYGIYTRTYYKSTATCPEGSVVSSCIIEPEPEKGTIFTNSRGVHLDTITIFARDTRLCVALSDMYDKEGVHARDV